jgi:uncharacterized membrane protein
MLEVFARSRRSVDSTPLVAAAAGGAAMALAASALAKGPRRARLADRVTSVFHHLAALVGKAQRDIKNRSVGLAAWLSGWSQENYVDDEVLHARVRSTLGRFTTHAHGIRVSAHDGTVTLSGPILRQEAARLIHAAHRVRGVRRVENALEVHDRDDIPALQGGTTRIAHVPEVLQEHWTPSLRISAGIAGGLVLSAGLLRSRRAGGIGLAGIGSLLLARAVLDKPLGRILGLGAQRGAIDLQKTVTIWAPIEEVFAYWADFERYPTFMEHVLDVKMVSDRRTHWKIRGPLGTPIEWDANITSVVPNEKIAWRSIVGSLIESAGVIRFERAQDGLATRLDVRLSYNPIAGYLGHGIAALFGSDPKKLIDADILRLKSLLEEGKATVHGREITRGAIPIAPIGIQDDDGQIPT